LQGGVSRLRCGKIAGLQGLTELREKLADWILGIRRLLRTREISRLQVLAKLLEFLAEVLGIRL
jgi:hypothetical protein